MLRLVHLNLQASLLYLAAVRSTIVKEFLPAGIGQYPTQLPSAGQYQPGAGTAAGAGAVAGAVAGAGTIQYPQLPTGQFTPQQPAGTYISPTAGQQIPQYPSALTGLSKAKFHLLHVAVFLIEK